MGFVQTTLARWRKDMTIPFPFKHHPWMELELTEMKQELARALEAYLRSADASPGGNDFEIQRIIGVVWSTMKRLDIVQFLDCSQKEWERMLSNEGLMIPALSRAEAKVAAKLIMKLLGNRV